MEGLRTACLADPLTFTVTQARVERQGKGVHQLMDEGRAYALARRVGRAPDYRVLEVRQAWSAAVAWQVEIEDRRTGERLLLLDEDQFNARLMTARESITVNTAAVS